MKMRFSVRKGKQRHSLETEILLVKQYVCSKEGRNKKDEKINKFYSKLATQTGCQAMIHFSVSVEQDIWTVMNHVRVHNHDLCIASQRHLIRSQMGVKVNQLKYLLDLNMSGAHVSSIIMFIRNQAGGSPNVGFTPRDAYNNLSYVKGNELYGGDASILIDTFKQRKDDEENFYFYFELDCNSRLCSLFFRDGQMKKHYELFWNLLVHDTAYRTNKYNMICGPFVEMNHHTQNVMFGCGFLVNEMTESFIWLFKTFFKSIDEKHLITIMTDQCLAMVAGIRDVFLNSRHRLLFGILVRI